MSRIQPTNFFSDLEQMYSDIYSVIHKAGWNSYNQIGITYRPNAANPWTDAAGSLVNSITKIRSGYEKDFTLYNPIPEYLKEQLELLRTNQNCKFGRIRIMRLSPKSGLSIHKDSEPRFHYVVDTNKKSFFCFNKDTMGQDLEVRAECYHIPRDGQWYYVDTTKTHWVYNGGESDRVHLVVSALL